MMKQKCCQVDGKKWADVRKYVSGSHENIDSSQEKGFQVSKKLLSIKKKVVRS